MSGVQAVISDFGGVLTSPLLDSFLAFQRSTGVSPMAFGQALGTIAERHGEHPLYELESGRVTEQSFLSELASELTAQLGREVKLGGFREAFFENLHPNDAMIDYMRGLRDRGYRMAICTNNVKEWEPLWRAKLPVDEIFDVVVDSAFVGTRKPEPRIYEITLDRLGVPAAGALLLDDVDVNCDAARSLGMQAVHFRSNDQAIEELEVALSDT